MLRTWLSDVGFWAFSAFTIIDLIAATTNAFNGALLARRPDHYKHFTVVGIILMATLAGIGGGATRDVLLNKNPAALINPWYLIFCFLAVILALFIAFRGAQRFRDGAFQFMTAFSLPWYAVVGAQAALQAHLPYLAAVLFGGDRRDRRALVRRHVLVRAPQAVHPGEWFVGTAVLASVIYVILYELGLSIWPATLITVAIAFTFRLAALFFRWEEPEPWEPKALRAGEPKRALRHSTRQGVCSREGQSTESVRRPGRSHNLSVEIAGTGHRLHEVTPGSRTVFR